MKFIATTATSLERLKRRAKDIQRTTPSAHHEALEAAASEAGYQSWFHALWCEKQTRSKPGEKESAPQVERPSVEDTAKDYMAYLARRAAGAHITHFPARGDIFHSVEIDGAYFYGTVGADSPSVVHKTNRQRGYELGDVQLGVSLICKSLSNSAFDHKDEWAACKYGPSEPRIWLGHLPSSTRFALAHEFGIPVVFPYHDPYEDLGEEVMAWPFGEGGQWLFKESPAFNSLVDKARRHPRKARLWGMSSYLGDWGRYTRLAAGVPVESDIAEVR